MAPRRKFTRQTTEGNYHLGILSWQTGKASISRLTHVVSFCALHSCLWCAKTWKGSVVWGLPPSPPSPSSFFHATGLQGKSTWHQLCVSGFILSHMVYKVWHSLFLSTVPLGAEVMQLNSSDFTARGVGIPKGQMAWQSSWQFEGRESL